MEADGVLINRAEPSSVPFSREVVPSSATKLFAHWLAWGLHSGFARFEILCDRGVNRRDCERYVHNVDVNLVDVCVFLFGCFVCTNRKSAGNENFGVPSFTAEGCTEDLCDLRGRHFSAPDRNDLNRVTNGVFVPDLDVKGGSILW